MGHVVEANCASCGQKHTVLLEDADMLDKLRYTFEYTCPATSETVPFSTSEWGHVTYVRPRDAVLLRRVPRSQP